MTLWSTLVAPFADYGFMRRALVATVALGLSSGPVGVLLVLRRMSLVGDAMSHAVLPGAAIGFIAAGGLSLTAMGLGGIIAGLSVALLAGLVSRTSVLREDASFASFYLISLALGVLIVSMKGSNLDLLHVLFGTVLAIDAPALILVAGITTVTLVVFAIIYRPLIVECFDPTFLRSVDGRGSLYHAIFLLLVVLNLVAGFQTLGTLMAVGAMMIPAAVAQLWATRVPIMLACATCIAILSGYGGLLLSFHAGWPSGPTIILVAGAAYIVSLILAPAGPLRLLSRARPGVLPHRLDAA